MDLAQLIERHPVLYHMAEDGTWPSIRERGLLSTTALCDLFEVPEPLRQQVLGEVRKTSITLTRADYGSVVIRDQGPLKFLNDVLDSQTSFQEYLDILNGRVFFWVDRARLLRLLEARRYRKHHQVVLQVDTSLLLTAHPDAELAALNTGSVHVPSMPTRGRSTFQTIADYPYDDWRRRRGAGGDALVELTVPYAVPGVAAYVRQVERWYGGEPIEVLHPSPTS